jgi:hypothetical protein
MTTTPYAQSRGRVLTDATGTPYSSTNPIPSAPRATTGTKSAVNSAAVSTTLLAANTSRKGATITNTDANALLIDGSGGTASATSYTYRVLTGGVVEVPFGYTGLITGIWEADGAGAAVVVEYT